MHLPNRRVFGAPFWNSSLIILAISVFFNGFGTGVVNASSTNFFVQVLGLSGTQVLWLQGLREIPGLLLIGIAALLSRFSLVKRAFGAVALMGIGYAFHAWVGSYSALIAAAIAASLGFHVWLPLQGTIGMLLVEKQYSGQVMGSLASAGALASLAGMGGVALLANRVPLRWFFVTAGVLILGAALMLLRLPSELGDTKIPQPRFFFRKRYWLYYVLTFFEGSRIQLFAAFGNLILVQNYHYTTQQISLLLSSGLLNFIMAPIFGRWLDQIGERAVLTSSYTALALCFVGYATIHNGLILGVILVVINLLTMLSIGLSTYVNRIAPPSELAPTLNSGVSVNHITSVGMALVAGSLLRQVGYELLCWGVVVIILLSVPFTLAIKRSPEPQEPAAI
ncbi:MAG: MFS transporter [Chloroflexi bacterium]|nr:MFS transporter [Chloroflexota bacterium]